MKGTIIGGGTWSGATYNATTAKRVATGTTFSYHTTGMATGKVHEILDVKIPNANGDLIRESRDSDEHPNAFPIAVLFDVTGSMGKGPRKAVEKLPGLYGTILRKGYVEDPQILFGAIGDSHTDRFPIQIGQFESDNRADEQLDKIILEGNGGGQKSEGYELAAFYLAVAAELDSLDKRGEKGLLFIVGDELNKPDLHPEVVRNHLGDEFVAKMTNPEGPMSIEEVYDLLKEKFEVYYLLPNESFYYRDPEILEHWQDLLGADHVVKLEDIEALVETIAMIVGMEKGTLGVDQIADDLRDAGTSDEKSIVVAAEAVKSVVKVDDNKAVQASEVKAVGGPADL